MEFIFDTNKGKGLNVLSLFDGMSCGRIALDRAGILVNKYYASEIDKYCIKVSQANYPDTIQIGDVRQIDSSNLPKIDLLIGGSPCQGFSYAGKGLNIKDPRSKLFFEYARLLEALKPKYILLENVKMARKYLDVITEILDVPPVLIKSDRFSAQDRRRYYWTNIPIAEIPESNPLCTEDILEDEVDDKYFVNPKRAVKILDDETNRRKIAYIGTDSQGGRIYTTHSKSVCLCAGGGGLGAKMGLYALPCLSVNRIKKRQNGRRFKPPKSKFYSLTVADRHGVLTNHKIRKLTPLECERLQTIPDGFSDVGISDNQRYRMIANGWTIDVIAHILRGIE